MPKPASQLVRLNPTLKILLHGDSGTGKTTFGAMAPKPLILLTELKGAPSIFNANPEAHIEEVRDLNAFHSIMEKIKRGVPCEYNKQPAFRVDKEPYQTIVLDSLSDFHENIRKLYESRAKKDDNDKDNVDWGKIQDRVKTTLDGLSSLPVNVVCLTLSDEIVDKQKRRSREPLLYGRIKKTIGQWFNAVGWTNRTLHEGEIEYGVTWSAGRFTITKSVKGWPNRTLCRFYENPGDTSLGSLLLATFKDMMVAHNPTDNESYVIGENNNE